MSSSPRPRRPLTVTFTLLLGLSSLGLSDCAGELDPRLSGPTGTGGSAPCDAPAMVFDMPAGGLKCAQVGCHDSSALAAAGLNLKNDAALIGRLLDVMPNDGTATGAMCAGAMPYLVGQSSPAMGLLLQKLAAPPPCGIAMPYPGIELLNPTEIACVTSWATAVTTGVLTP